MPGVDLFLGVVSHTRSRFAHNQGSSGFPGQLTEALQALGVSVELEIEVRDLFSEASEALGPSVVQESLSEQLRLEGAWARYTDSGRGLSARQKLRLLTLRVARQWRRFNSPPLQSMVRLLNIELSHLSLLESGLASGSPWIMIVEDDGECSDIDDCAAGLNGLMRDAPPEVAFANFSESFDVRELGLDELLRDSGISWQGDVEREIARSERPTTNTVCAMLYRSDFAARIVQDFRDQGLFPVVPIDWKLNSTLMRLFAAGVLDHESCMWVVPAPITQMSMHPGATS